MNQIVTMSSGFPADIPQLIQAEITPESKLPNELLTEIFRLSMPNLVEIPSLDDDDDPSWTLPRVSKKWRSILLGIPELWTSVYINYETWFRKTESLDPEKVTAMSNRVLMRSRDALISLKIEASTDGTTKWEPMIKLIFSHAPRIRYLELRIGGDALWKTLASPSISFRSLEFLSISNFDGTDNAVQSVLFQDSPCLKIVELSIEFNWALMVPHLPWPNLEHLSLTQGYGLSTPIAHAIVRQCPNMLTFQITLSAGYNHTTTAIAPITCLVLKTLLVKISTLGTVADFLAPLTLPCLTTLELTVSPYIMDDDEEWDYSATLIILPAFKQLTHLRIDIPIPHRYNMTPFLMSIPNILVLELPLLSVATLQFLSSGEHLPCLQVFEAFIPLTSLSSYLSMLNHWSDAGLSTRAIIFWKSGGREINSDDKSIINKLVDRGLLEMRLSNRKHTKMRDFVPKFMES